MTAWHYSINYGPDGEANYANVHAADGQFVGNLRTHHAIAICNAFAVCEKLAATPSSPVSAPSPAGGVREAVKVEIREYTPPRGERVMIWVNDRMVMKDGYCIDSVPRHVAPVIVAALSSPATPEPVSAPAGEVVEARRLARRLFVAANMMEANPLFPRGQAREDLKADLRALSAAIDALSNAPGHGEGGIMSGIREDHPEPIIVEMPEEPDEMVTDAIRKAWRETRAGGVCGMTIDAQWRSEFARELAVYRAIRETLISSGRSLADATQKSHPATGEKEGR